MPGPGRALRLSRSDVRAGWQFASGSIPIAVCEHNSTYLDADRHERLCALVDRLILDAGLVPRLGHATTGRGPTFRPLLVTPSPVHADSGIEDFDRLPGASLFGVLVVQIVELVMASGKRRCSECGIPCKPPPGGRHSRLGLCVACQKDRERARNAAAKWRSREVQDR